MIRGAEAGAPRDGGLLAMAMALYL
jgi:hypothetical protein